MQVVQSMPQVPSDVLHLNSLAGVAELEVLDQSVVLGANSLDLISF